MIGLDDYLIDTIKSTILCYKIVSTIESRACVRISPIGGIQAIFENPQPKSTSLDRVEFCTDQMRRSKYVCSCDAWTKITERYVVRIRAFPFAQNRCLGSALRLGCSPRTKFTGRDTRYHTNVLPPGFTSLSPLSG
jgi:hypothetical protein